MVQTKYREVAATTIVEKATAFLRGRKPRPPTTEPCEHTSFSGVLRESSEVSDS